MGIGGEADRDSPFEQGGDTISGTVTPSSI